MANKEERLKITGFGVATVGPDGNVLDVKIFRESEGGDEWAKAKGGVNCIVELTFSKDSGVKTIEY